jgi:hypothetical protein
MRQRATFRKIVVLKGAMALRLQAVERRYAAICAMEARNWWIQYTIRMQMTTNKKHTHPHTILAAGFTQNITIVTAVADDAARYAKSIPAIVMEPLITTIPNKQTIITTTNIK